MWREISAPDDLYGSGFRTESAWRSRGFFPSVDAEFARSAGKIYFHKSQVRLGVEKKSCFRLPLPGAELQPGGFYWIDVTEQIKTKKQWAEAGRSVKAGAQQERVFNELFGCFLVYYRESDTEPHS